VTLAARCPQVLKQLKVKGKKLNMLDRLITLAPKLLAQIVKLTHVDIPRGSHISAKTVIKSGFGVTAGACFGWADTKGFHMVGVHGKVGVMAKLGGNLLAGAHALPARPAAAPRSSSRLRPRRDSSRTRTRMRRHSPHALVRHAQSGGLRAGSTCYRCLTPRPADGACCAVCRPAPLAEEGQGDHRLWQRCARAGLHAARQGRNWGARRAGRGAATWCDPCKFFCSAVI
jgi:hypothetical protein